MKPQNKVALVTGGSRGIGFGIAEKLAEAGWNLAINGVRDESQVQETLQVLRAKNVNVIYCQGNIGDLSNHQNMVKRVEELVGPINLLVNNAGVAPKERMDILDTTPESYQRLMDINLKGPFFLTQLIARRMADEKSRNTDFQGCIINIGSISATVASTSRAEYCISKAGIGMMSLLFASRMGEFDIPVFEVRPGIIKTDMTSGVQEKYDKLIADGLTIQKRWGQPEDIGKTVTALARGDFNYSTGQVFSVDGGLTINRL